MNLTSAVVNSTTSARNRVPADVFSLSAAQHRKADTILFLADTILFLAISPLTRTIPAPFRENVGNTCSQPDGATACLHFVNH
jgi:hypothetical protein